MHVWNVIATDGVVGQMTDGNGYGMNWPGLYDPELMVHYANGRLAHADELSETVKMAALCGRYAIDTYHGRHDAMTRDLAFELAAARGRVPGPARRLTAARAACLPGEPPGRGARFDPQPTASSRVR
jgi:amidase